MKTETYTQQEVLKNIKTLTEKMDNLKHARTALSKDINSIKKQIEEWEKLDISQYKIF